MNLIKQQISMALFLNIFTDSAVMWHASHNTQQYHGWLYPITMTITDKMYV